MAIQTKEQLKAWFMRGLYPTQQQFHHWMDSYWHKDEKIGAAAMDAAFVAAINAKAEQTALQAAAAVGASNTHRIASLENSRVIPIRGMERTGGCIYLRVRQEDYTAASSEVSINYRPVWAWLNNNDCDSGPDEVGEQDLSVAAGYEPVYLCIGDWEPIPVCYRYGDAYQLQLKDIHGKSLLIDASYYTTDYVTAIGITPETTVPDAILPANALVINYLSENYTATADTADNVRVNHVGAANLQFVLPLAADMSEDKNIKVYVGADSAYALLIDNAGADTSVTAGGYAECFFSVESQTWTVTAVTYEEEKASASVINGSYLSLKQISSGANTGYWYKVCTMTSTTTGYNKHTLSIDILSEGAEHGVVYGNLFYNLNKSAGEFYCMQLASDSATNLSPSDFCIRWSGASNGNGQTSELWMRCNDSSRSFYFAVRAYGGAGKPTFAWANNTWYGSKEYLTAKPTAPAYYGKIVNCIDKRSVAAPVVVSDSTEKLLSLHPTANVAVSASAQTPITAYTAAAAKDWTLATADNGYITMPSAGWLEISGFLTVEAGGGITTSRRAIVNHRNGSNVVAQVMESDVHLSSTSSDGKKRGSIPIQALIQVAAGDQVQVCGYTESNTATVYASSTLIFKLKS